MNIIFTMCFTGSSLYLLYLLAVHFFKNSLSIRWRYHALRLSLLAFITPLGFIKFFLSKTLIDTEFQLRGNAPVMTLTSHGIYANHAFEIAFFIVFLWIIIAVFFFWKQRTRYFHFKKTLLQSITEVTNPVLLDYLAIHKRELGIRSKIRLYHTQDTAAFTTGVIHPIIVLPETFLLEQEKLIIKHELIHIKQNDTFFLLLRHLVSCLYWFNPLAGFLDHELGKVTELSCDKSVISNICDKEKKEYILALIDIASFDVQFQGSFASSFNSSKKYMKERIDLIMNYSSKKMPKKLLVLLTLCMILCSSFTASAYQTPSEFYMDWHFKQNPLSNFDSYDSVIAFQSGGFATETVTTPILYDSQFSDINGNIYQIDNSNRTPYGICKHNFVDGEYSKHTKNKTGGCLTKYYSAQRCEKCGTLKVGKLIRELSYTTCPH